MCRSNHCESDNKFRIVGCHWLRSSTIKHLSPAPAGRLLRKTRLLTSKVNKQPNYVRNSVNYNSFLGTVHDQPGDDTSVQPRLPSCPLSKWRALLRVDPDSIPIDKSGGGGLASSSLSKVFPQASPLSPHRSMRVRAGGGGKYKCDSPLGPWNHLRKERRRT
jgi:hypothetical protein